MFKKIHSIDVEFVSSRKNIRHLCIKLKTDENVDNWWALFILDLLTYKDAQDYVKSILKRV